MDKIEKMDVVVSSASSLEKPSKNFKRKKIVFLSLGVILTLIIVLAIAIIIPLKKTYSSALLTYKDARGAYDAIKKQNVTLASENLLKAQKNLEVTQKEFKALSFVAYIPLLNWYYNDVDHLLKAGASGLQSSSILVDSVKPYADVLGLKGQGSFVMGSAEQRVQTAVMTMGKITPRIDEIVTSFKKAQQEIDSVNPNHYPSFLGGKKVKEQMESLKAITNQGVAFMDQAQPLVKVLPSLLGETSAKKYLILFQNDKELRPTGGFITAYSVFRIDKGIIQVERSDDIYSLDNSMRIKTKAPDPILKYLPKVSTFNLRDSNLSPDFVESMKTFNSLYKNSSSKVDVDGIIALDTNVLVSTIKILDDEVMVGGLRLTSKNDKRCNCPQVIYELEDNISRPVNYVKSGRKDLLGAVLYTLMQKALKSSPKLYWGPLVQELITETNQKHVLFYLYDGKAQSGIEALNAGGRIKNFEGDYLHINESNMGGAKSNMYVNETVEQDIKIDGDGSITKTLTIKYKNPHPPSDCDLERGGLCLNAILRDWIRIYVPKGSQLIKSQGSEVKVSTYDELGKTVFDGFLTVRPLGAAVYIISYKLPFKVSSSTMPLLIQKQPGTQGNDYLVKVNGRDMYKFPLLTDKEVAITR